MNDNIKNSTNYASYPSYNYQDQNNCENLIEGNINQVNYNNMKIIDLINLNNRLKEVNGIHKNENKKLVDNLLKMKIQIEDLNEEKKQLMIKNTELEKELQKILFFKNENERLNNELFNLRNKYNNEFEEYRQIKKMK